MSIRAYKLIKKVIKDIVRFFKKNKISPSCLRQYIYDRFSDVSGFWNENSFILYIMILNNNEIF